jgi:hypothetical protein
MSVRVLSKKGPRKPSPALATPRLICTTVEKECITQGQYRIDVAFENLRVSPVLSRKS